MAVPGRKVCALLGKYVSVIVSWNVRKPTICRTNRHARLLKREGRRCVGLRLIRVTFAMSVQCPLRCQLTDILLSRSNDVQGPKQTSHISCLEVYFWDQSIISHVQPFLRANGWRNNAVIAWKSNMRNADQPQMKVELE